MAENHILIGKGMVGNNPPQVKLLGSMANRHGLIAGATGTGKTVTLQILAEQFSAMGTPVFLSDIKGDLSGISSPGKPHKEVDRRNEFAGREGFEFSGSPVTFWDVFGEQGHPLRTTVSEMGPLLLGELLGLNDTQAGILTIAFMVAKDEGMPMLDLKDLRSMVQHLGDNSADYKTEYGNISTASVGAIQRRLLELEHEGAENIFGEPAITLDDLMQTNRQGRGMINVLAADKLYHSPKLYATLLMWLLTELFEQLPEVGDADKPKLVFFFDEAHLLFDGAPDALVEKIEQVVRLIRSKGVGVYFITQSPLDVPESVLGQLGNRVQHALRAFTPKDQKSVKVAADTFRQNPAIDTQAVITQLGLGEALVSTLNEEGQPTPVEQTLIVPPMSQIGPIEATARKAIIEDSVLYGHFEKAIDRESAHEMLKVKMEEKLKRQAELEALEAEEKEQRRKSRRQGPVEAFIKTIMRTLGSQIGRQIFKSIIKGLFRR